MAVHAGCSEDPVFGVVDGIGGGQGGAWTARPLLRGGQPLDGRS